MDAKQLCFLATLEPAGDSALVLKLQEELEEKNRQLERVTLYLDSIIKNINEGLMFITAEGIITTYNMAAEKILGIKLKDALYRNFIEVFNDKAFGFSMHQALKTLQCPGINFAKYLFKGKYEKELEVSTSAVFKRGKCQKGMIILLRDITKQRQLIKRQEQDRRLKEIGQMAATVAHEIRNPLGGIEGFASLLQKDVQEDPKLSKMAGFIIEGSKTISLLIENLLSSARPLSPHFIEVDIVALCNEIIEQFQTDLSLSKDIDIILQAYYPLIIVPADKVMIRSSIMHLVRNAIDAIEGRGQIHLTLFTKDDHAIITVKDSGMGICQEHLEHLFTPFFTSKDKGTGLGLYESYRMIESHGGHIDVKSSKECGTLFIISLPLRGCTL